MRQDFKALAEVATSDYKDAGFCTVAALALTLDWSFGKAHRWMAKHAARRNRTGVYPYLWEGAIKKAAESVGKRFSASGRHYLPDGRAMTLTRFCKENPTGTYYVRVNKHALAIVNGVMHDWTAETAGRRKIQASFKLTEV